MAKGKLDAGTRVILATAAVVLGLAVGIVALAVINSGGGGERAAYQPFFAGQSDRVTNQIQKDGPVCFQDPKAGERSFCLDLQGDQFVAYHVLPQGGTADCLVQWDRAEKRYENKCSRSAGRPRDPGPLPRPDEGDQREGQRLRRRAHLHAGRVAARELADGFVLQPPGDRVEDLLTGGSAAHSFDERVTDGESRPLLVSAVFELDPPRPVADLQAGPLDLVTFRLGHDPSLSRTGATVSGCCEAEGQPWR